MIDNLRSNSVVENLSKKWKEILAVFLPFAYVVYSITTNRGISPQSLYDFEGDKLERQLLSQGCLDQNSQPTIVEETLPLFTKIPLLDQKIGRIFAGMYFFRKMDKVYAEDVHTKQVIELEDGQLFQWDTMTSEGLYRASASVEKNKKWQKPKALLRVDLTFSLSCLE